MSWRDPVLAGIRAGRPRVGPASVHIDVTNGCNAACITCWDHSPLLTEARPASWKRRRLPLPRFHAIVAQLASFGTVRHVVISGMGEPLTHPDIYEMIAAIKQQGWELTVISNLVAADVDRLCDSGVDQLLAGVQGVTPKSYTAFHPGWTERHFFDMCAILRRLGSTSTRVRHVQVINRDTAPELVEMVRFGRIFKADRVTYKLAALHHGTEGCAITPEQRQWLRQTGIPEARALSARLGVPTNLDLFEQQVAAGAGDDAASTAPLDRMRCHMGYVFTRITVDEDVLFCCNVNVRVGTLAEADLPTLWFGERWQSLRDHLARGAWFTGCDQCGKLEQNLKWATLVDRLPDVLPDHELTGVSV